MPDNVLDFCKKTLVMVIGYIILGFGIVLTIKSNLGVSSWPAFHLGISNLTPLSFGQATQVVSFTIIVLGYLLGSKPQFATIANMVLMGIIVDIINNSSIIPADPSFFVGLIYVILGTILFGVGTGLYLNANLGAGPRDGVMLGLNRKMGWKISIVRTVMEVTVLLAGYLMGSPVGIGTIIFSFGVGHTVQWSMKHLIVFKKGQQDSVRVEEIRDKEEIGLINEGLFLTQIKADKKPMSTD